MHEAENPATVQLGLFATTTQIPQLPREINPKIVCLLARLLRQYAEREAAATARVLGVVMSEKLKPHHLERFSTFASHRLTRSYITWRARSCSTPCRSVSMSWAGGKWKWWMTT